jgi:hypothetical protein
LASIVDNWFYTQGIALTAGTPYSISYRYGISYNFAPESFRVAMGTSPDAAAMTTILANHPDINNASPLTDAVGFTPASSGTYYFGFHAYSSRDRDQLYLDDIAVTLSVLPICPATYQPANVTVKV